MFYEKANVEFFDAVKMSKNHSQKVEESKSEFRVLPLAPYMPIV